MNRFYEFDLQSANTLAVPSSARQLVRATGRDAVVEVLEEVDRQQCPLTVLGGGSNVVLPERIEGLVLQPLIMGRQIRARVAGTALVDVGAGEDWPALVHWSLEQQLYGLENLALIPGTVGAAPVQNIGAYGVELSEFIEAVEVVHRVNGRREVLTRADCEFGYRDSVFKRRLRDQCVIVAVTLRLRTEPRVNLDYPALQQAVGARLVVLPQDIFDAVCQIRRARLPDPREVPNAGSFFKNPVIPVDQSQALQARYPDLVTFPTAVAGQRKLAAAWLIDQAGWKGASRYGVQVHDRQALVLTNPGRRPGSAVLALADDIREDIASRFGILLEREPQLLGWT